LLALTTTPITDCPELESVAVVEEVEHEITNDEVAHLRETAPVNPAEVRIIVPVPDFPAVILITGSTTFTEKSPTFAPIVRIALVDEL